MEDERDAEDAIRALDRIEFGRRGRRLCVEWTKQERERGIKRSEGSRKALSFSKPAKTLFVINFDTYNTRTRDLERHFDPYGKILNVRIRKNFAFIQYESQEDAVKALDATNLSKLLDRVITVEFSKDDDDRRNGHASNQTRDRSPWKGHDRIRSPSPYKRERGSPDYGHNRGRSPSPLNGERASPKYGRDLSRSPRNKRESDYNHIHSPIPERQRSHGAKVHGPYPGKRENPDYGHDPSPSPQRVRRQRVSSDDVDHDRSVVYTEGESPPHNQFGSQSPKERRRGRS